MQEVKTLLRLNLYFFLYSFIFDLTPLVHHTHTLAHFDSQSQNSLCSLDSFVFQSFEHFQNVKLDSVTF